MNVLVLVFMFVTAIVLGPMVIIVTFLYMRRRTVNKQEVQALQDQISQLRAEMEDMKEQIADLIIGAN